MMLDILEEHLEEAAWLYDVRARLLRSYHVTLADLAEWDERWMAHVDGLVIGDAASRPILERGLDEGDEGTACAAAAAYACWDSPSDRSRVERLLTDRGFPHPGPFVLGLELAPFDRHETWAADWLRAEAPGLRTAGLEVCRHRGLAVPAEVLRPLLRLDEQPPEVLRAALRLAGDLKIAGCNSYLDAAMGSGDPGVAGAALEAGILAGLRGARERWRATVRAAGAAADPAMLERLGVYGAFEDLPFLLQALEEPALGPAAIRALGRLGHAGAAEALVERAGDPEVGRLAVHSLATLFGARFESAPPGPGPVAARGGPAGAPETVSGTEAESADDDEDLDPFEGLTAPDPEAVRRWWAENSSRFPRAVRWRSGAAFSAGAALATLREGPLADRPAAAIEAAMAVKEMPVLETARLAPFQQRWIARWSAPPAPAPSPAARPPRARGAARAPVGI
jgi:uncharacterized protein (TIGR02270 family)